MKKKKCTETAIYGDDHGDNPCTFHCVLAKGHFGKHQEEGNMYGEWEYDLRWEKIKPKK